MTIAQTLNPRIRRFPTWPLYGLGVIPMAVLFYQAVAGQLGPDPMRVLEHQYGEWALQLLIATFLVTPVRNLTGISLLKFRRAFGLLAFFYVMAHFLVWLVLDKQFYWAEILTDLTKRPYIFIGMAAFLILIPLAVTSTNGWIRRLGARNWGRLHKIGLIAPILGAVHYLLLVKAWPIEPFIYLGIAILLAILRLSMPKLRILASGQG